MKRLLVILAGLLAVGALAAPTAAHAQPTDPAYPPEPAAAVSDGTVEAGDAVVFSGTARPFEVLTITVTYSSGNGGNNFFAPPRRVPRVVIGTVTADAAGDWSIRVRLTETGVATLRARGPFTDVSRQVRVLADGGGSGGGSGGLPRTDVAGGRLPAMVLSGIGAVLLGGLLVFGAFRWRRRTRGIDA
jgi:hypothetical protein